MDSDNLNFLLETGKSFFIAFGIGCIIWTVSKITVGIINVLRK